MVLCNDRLLCELCEMVCDARLGSDPSVGFRLEAQVLSYESEGSKERGDAFTHCCDHDGAKPQSLKSQF